MQIFDKPTHFDAIQSHYAGLKWLRNIRPIGAKIKDGSKMAEKFHNQEKSSIHSKRIDSLTCSYLN